MSVENMSGLKGVCRENVAAPFVPDKPLQPSLANEDEDSSLKYREYLNGATLRKTTTLSSNI